MKKHPLYNKFTKYFKEIDKKTMVDEESYTEEPGKTSKINSAMLINLTLTELWKDFFKHFREGKYLSSVNDLDCIWTILGGEKGIEGKEIEINYNKIEKELKESGGLQDGISSEGFNKINKDFIIKSSKQKGILLKKALFLRRLQNVQGMGKAYNLGEEDYMD